jgi:hypothetical protein
MLAMAMAVIGPCLWWEGRRPGSLRRWGWAAGTTVLFVGPWAWLFLVRSADVRTMDEGASTFGWAMHHAVGLLDWIIHSPARPSWLASGALLILPWTLAREHRRLGWGLVLVLLGSLVLALGPDPSLHQRLPPPNPHLSSGFEQQVGAAWAPYTWMQSLPVMGWFHTPDRLLTSWTMLGPIALGLALDRLTRSRTWLFLSLAIGCLLFANWEIGRMKLWPKGMADIPHFEALDTVAAHPVEGPLLDLPPRPPGLSVQRFQLLQLTHGRPIPYHMTLGHLTTDPMAEHSKNMATLRWLSPRERSPTPPDVQTVRADLGRLAAEGYVIVALHAAMIPRDRRQDVVRIFREALGRPLAQHGGRWIAWELAPVN